MGQAFPMKLTIQVPVPLSVATVPVIGGNLSPTTLKASCYKALFTRLELEVRLGHGAPGEHWGSEGMRFASMAADGWVSCWAT